MANRVRHLNIWLFELKEVSENRVKLREHVKQFLSDAADSALILDQDTSGRCSSSSGLYPLS